MSMELVPVVGGFVAEFACEHCQGKGIRAIVPVRMMPDDPFRELTVQDELRQQSYETYAERLKFPWWRRKDPFDLVFKAFIVGMIIWMAIVSFFFGTTTDAAFLFFGGVMLLVLVVIALNRQIIRLLRGGADRAWEEDRAVAQKMYEKILKEWGDITEPNKAVVWIPGETKEQAIRPGTTLVMLNIREAEVL